MLGQGRRAEASANAPVTTIDTRPFDAARPRGLNLGVPMKRVLLAAAVAALYALHQDLWFWASARPLVLGFVPIGLFYHACFAVACSVLMWVLVAHAWPSHLEDEADGGRSPGPP